MKTEWLEWLVLFKKYKSLQKVSDVCHVTPQNIGKMFNHLENEVGVQLFEKYGKTIRLTAAGVELADTAEKIVNSLELFKDKYSTQQTLSGSLEILSTSSQIMQDVLNSFMQRYPEVIVSYMDSSFEDALHYVKEHPDAIAFIPIWQNAAFYNLIKKYEPYCNIHMLYKDEQRAFVAKNSDLAQHKILSFKDLCGRKLVSYSKSGKTNEAKHILNSIVHKELAQNLDVMGTNSTHYFETVVKNNLAVGLGLYSNFKYMEDGETIISIKMQDDQQYPCIWCLVYNMNKKISVTDKVFIAILEQHCSHLAK